MAAMPGCVDVSRQIFEEPIHRMGRMDGLKGIYTGYYFNADWAEGVSGTPSLATETSTMPVLPAAMVGLPARRIWMSWPWRGQYLNGRTRQVPCALRPEPACSAADMSMRIAVGIIAFPTTGMRFPGGGIISGKREYIWRPSENSTLRLGQIVA